MASQEKVRSYGPASAIHVAGPECRGLMMRNSGPLALTCRQQALPPASDLPALTLGCSG